MEKELRKRLEEAAKEKQREVTPHKDWGDVRYGFNRGAEWMFKECGGETVMKEMRQTILGQVKEWIRKNISLYASGEYTITGKIADLEADMNKLWEGEK